MRVGSGWPLHTVDAQSRTQMDRRRGVDAAFSAFSPNLWTNFARHYLWSSFSLLLIQLQ
jgi:hypothetical protein